MAKKKSDPYVFMEWRENGRYYGGNHRESEVPGIVQRLRERKAKGEDISNPLLNDEVEIELEEPRSASETGRSLLDAILDKVQAGEREVTLDTEGYTKPQVDRIIATAKGRGLSASYDGRHVLIRDLSRIHG